jgi:hypothetical protein
MCNFFSLSLQVYKGIAKFKDGPLQNEEEKTIMYDHWAPSSGTAPQTPIMCQPFQPDIVDMTLKMHQTHPPPELVLGT